MRLIHYSDRPLGAIYSVPDQPETFKPAGLWVSVEGQMDWPEWCRDNDFGLNRLGNETEIILAPDAGILRLASAAAIDDFTREFGVSIVPGMEGCVYADWARVATRWQGIIIAPYIYSRRLHDGCAWYYAWDCASGCIWDAAAIQAVIPQSLAPFRWGRAGAGNTEETACS